MNKAWTFYPDYIVGDTKGNIWIIETKGGEDAYGYSKNIDIKIENKYEALKTYAQKYNVNPSYNEELKRRCPELDGYIKYVEKTRKYHKTGMTYEEAVKKAVDECIEEGILKEFFVKNKAEVISMTIFEYDEEEHMRLEREEQYRKGEEAGEARGIEIGEARGEARGIEIGEARGENRGRCEGLKNQIRKKLAKGKMENATYICNTCGNYSYCCSGNIYCAGR